MNEFKKRDIKINIQNEYDEPLSLIVQVENNELKIKFIRSFKEAVAQAGEFVTIDKGSTLTVTYSTGIDPEW